jgi:heme exporter protein D
MGVPPTYTSDDKLRWEIEKLQAEIEQLRRPWIRQPTSWIAVATTLLALAGGAVQFSRSEREYQLADIKRERANLDAEKADRTRMQYQGQIAQVQDQIKQAQETLRELEIRRAKVLEDFSATVVRTRNSGTHEARSDLEKAQESLSALKTANVELRKQTEETVGNLQALGEAIGSQTPSLPAFAVIASFQTLGHATVFAKELAEKDSAYPLEVYLREPKSYAVTLGGYLSYDEANKRILYARANGLAADAYVRLAKDWGKPVLKLQK